MGPVRHLMAGVVLASCCRLVVGQEVLTDHQQRIEKAGTVLKYAIPASALMATFLMEPQNGGSDESAGQGSWMLMGGTPRHDLFLALGRAAITTGILKSTVDETRPNGGSNSFPSGHTVAAFTGAEFIRKEYGWAWGLPAYLAAGFVGWSRVEADEHYPHDVIAGAAIGILANHDFWRRDTRAGSLSVGAGPVISGGVVVPGLHFELIR